MRSVNGVGLFLAAAVAALSWGCSAGPGETGQGGAGGPGNNGGNGPGGNNTGAGNPGGGNDVGGFGGGIGGGNQGGSGGTTACAGVAVKGELIPLDMYIMLDKSGSMLSKTGPSGNGPTKWDAVTTALNAFFADPASDGLGVGIQFFPTLLPGTPETCTTNSQCGAAGPCLLKSCDNLGVLAPCNTNNDCGGAYCSQLGTCANNPSYYCFYNDPNYGPNCGVDPNGNNLGTCVKLTTSYCLNQDSCAGADYADPAVEIAALNGAGQALKDAIAGIEPGGATPTAPALGGAIDHAKAWAGAHPDHKVVAVLATDGLPTECSPQDITSIADLAENGQSGTPSILTFVIGVFGQGDVGAQENLDEIAQQGGTASAFFITDNQDVTAQFLAALHAIQGQTLSCEYQMPLPPDGSELDYGKVNVEYTPSGESMPQTVPYVGKGSACDASKGGWYYDQDPAAGQTPTKILMCPATCSTLKASGGAVNIKIGCQTIVPEAQ